MRCMAKLMLLVALTLMCIVQVATAQDANVEIAVLGTVSILMPEYGDNETVLLLPGGAAAAAPFPGLRIATWQGAPLLVEAGLSLAHIEDFTMFDVEVAIGATGRRGNNAAVPFIQGVVGLLNLSNGDSESEVYIGAQAGVRVFLKPEAATRLQVGYRRFVGDYGDAVLEIGFGLGVFL